MGLRKSAFLLVCALLGAAVAVLPAVAGSETSPTVSAESSAATCGALYPNCFSPSQIQLTAPGTVGFQNSSGVAHGVVWNGVPVEPTCTGVPVGSSATSFKGSCSFAQTGTYRFYCYVHGTSMSGTIVVNPSGTTTTTTGTQPGATTGTTTTSTSTGYASPPTASLPVAGGSGLAVALGRAQRGRVVRGSLQVPAADAGGRLEVDLLAKRAALGTGSGSSRVRVGRLVRTSLRAGRLSFAVALDAKARRALTRRRRLALVVKVTLAPAQGAAVVTSRSVVLHP